ncbi:MAG: PA2778 family cysteine peptidase [Gammaproteobacteria bacterium]|nr:PA2778 family cysteine peptidase [Gammaproteobacteria bacterium]
MLAVTLAALTAGCASRGPVLPDVVQQTGAAPSVELSRTPFFPQTEYYCGPAALATVLNSTGVEVGLDELGSRVYLPEKRGSLQVEVMAAARHFRRMPYRIDSRLEALLAELRAGRPVLVFQNLGIRLIPVWHYAVVVGYDARDDTIILRSGRTERRVMAAGDFLDTWERADQWGIVVLRSGEMPANPDPGRYLSAVAAMEDLVSAELAVEWLAAAREQWPGNPLVHFAHGNNLYATGDSAAAVRAYRRALSIDPALRPARNNLAHVLSEQGCQKEALAQIERALAGEVEEGLRDTLEETRAEIRQRMETGEAGACR